VLGSVDFEEKGNSGIEKALDEELRGTPGITRLLTDVSPPADRAADHHPRQTGHLSHLTIDERLQFVAEREIAAAVLSHNAASGSVIVMQPDTGDILAMASYPTFDPNVRWSAGKIRSPA